MATFKGKWLGKYSSPMDPMGNGPLVFVVEIPSVNSQAFCRFGKAREPLRGRAFLNPMGDVGHYLQGGRFEPIVLHGVLETP